MTQANQQWPGRKRKPIQVQVRGGTAVDVGGVAVVVTALRAALDLLVRLPHCAQSQSEQ